MEHAQHQAPHATAERPTATEPMSLADEIGVSAAELIEMIRSGQGLDVNQLVSRTLDDRRAA